MEKNKIGMATLIILLLLAIVAGCIAGFLVSQRTNLKKAEVSKNSQIVKEENVIEEKEEEKNVEKEESIEKEEEDLTPWKSITLNGKTYTISYKEEGKINEQMSKASLYVNGKKIRTFKHAGELGDSNNTCDVKILKGDTDYIVLDLTLDHFILADYIVVINQNEELVGIIHIMRGSTGIQTDDIHGHIINEDSIQYLDFMDGRENPTVVQYRVTVNEDILEYHIDKVYEKYSDEVLLSGGGV